MVAERQFDFWLGDWDCRWEGGRGTNSVTAELDGTVILERFEGGELRGVSVSVYDSGAASWRQTWVDSTRAYLDFAGGYADGEMVLRRAGRRMRFTEIGDESFVWLWEREREDGSSWELQWRIDYARRG
jgi:hypothetical protein